MTLWQEEESYEVLLFDRSCTALQYFLLRQFVQAFRRVLLLLQKDSTQDWDELCQELSLSAV